MILVNHTGTIQCKEAKTRHCDPRGRHIGFETSEFTA
jgi:hypothetical protein